MSRVTVTVQGQPYTIACREGEEARLARLAAELDRITDEVEAHVGPLGERRLAVMAGLRILGDLRAAEANVARLKERVAHLERAREEAVLAAEAAAIEAAGEIEKVAAAVDGLTARLNQNTRAMRANEPPER
ncbi:MAG: cell division protein ZapA [Pseudomonadota bacterium]